MQINIKVSYKLISALSLLMSMINHSQSSQIIKLAMPLQYLEKEVRDRIHFLHADKHQCFYKVASLFLIEVARHVQSTQKRELVIFLQYLKRKVLQLLLFSIMMQSFQIFCEGPVIFFVTCSLIKSVALVKTLKFS